MGPIIKATPSIIRKLSPIEQAFTLSNEASPLCVVCVLHLTCGPEIEKLITALEQLQSRHLLLRAGISKERGFHFFRLDPTPPIPLTITDRKDDHTWRHKTEQLLNTTFDKSGPLMTCTYLPAQEGGPCELIVCFHHAIIDGVAARLILHELLSLCGGISLPEIPAAANHNFPPDFRKGRLLKRLATFAGRQAAEERIYQKSGLSSPIPEHSRNAILSFRLSPATSRKLSLRAGREGLSLNSLLLAAITHAVCCHRHPGKADHWVRTISFADLRPAVIPPVSGLELGCYISMLRLCVPWSREVTIGQLGSRLRGAIFKASRRGEVFLMSILSKFLIRMTLRLRHARLGVSALSFIGKLDLEPQYGPVQLHNVEAFITNNRFGPEFSAFGKILFGAIGLDLTYLTAEIKEEQARKIVEEIKKSLEEYANFH